MMLSDGGYFWKEKTCNLRKLWYKHDTLGWDEDSALREGKWPDPYFDPYGFIRQWIEQISVDSWSCQTPENGTESLIISRKSYVNRSS